ncbi:MAG: cyclic nucleotide-binding domain-containing protein [Mycobacteriales bacterium]
MRVESSATSISWIPSEAVTGVMQSTFSTGVSHYDDPPPSTIDDLEELRAADRFRFANRIAAGAVFDAGQAVEWAHTGGGVMGATTVRLGRLGATFAGVSLPVLRPDPELGNGWIRFTQTVGGRTALPLPWATSRPPFFRMHAPFVWTTLTLTLHADGRAEFAMPGASPFPRHWVYGPSGTLELKAGVADWETWLGQPSWRTTPWGEVDSPALVTAAETELERELSTVIMRGGVRPLIRTLAAGDVLTRQGDEASSLYLVLDGVIDVSVDASSLGEVGPGAILGEHAVLEGGRRTASLTAVTPARIAEASADAIDLNALQQLADGHRREDHSAAETPR